MTTQSVTNQPAGLFDSMAVSTPGKGRSLTDSFEQIIVQSRSGSYGRTGDSVTQAQAPKTNSAAKSDPSAKADSNSEKTDRLSKVNQQSETTRSSKADQLSKTDQPVNQPSKAGEADPVNGEKTEDLQEAMAQIAGILQDVAEAVKNVLGLSEEELNRLLAEQGLTQEDLLLSENLSQLVLADSGQTDLMALLTDEKLTGQLNLLLSTVEDLKESAGIRLTQEQLKELLESIKQSEETATLPKGAVDGMPDDTTGTETAGQENAVPVVTDQRTREKADAGLKDALTNGAGLTDPEEEANVSTSRLTASQTEQGSGEAQSKASQEQYETFLNNLTAHAASTRTELEVGAHVTQIREIANQIIEQIKVSVQADRSSMELQLNPEQLGKVNLTVQSKNGVMTAHFVVENEISREAIESQLHVLKETLNEQGIKVETIEVTVAANSFDQYGEGQAGNGEEAQKNGRRGKLSLEEAMGIPEERLDTEDAAQTDGTDEIRGSRIDYTA